MPVAVISLRNAGEQQNNFLLLHSIFCYSKASVLCTVYGKLVQMYHMLLEKLANGKTLW